MMQINFNWLACSITTEHHPAEAPLTTSLFPLDGIPATLGRLTISPAMRLPSPMLQLRPSRLRPTTPPTVHLSSREQTFRLIPEQRTISISPNSPSPVKAATLTPSPPMTLNSPPQLSSRSPSMRPINSNLLVSSIKTAPPLAEASPTTLPQQKTGHRELMHPPISLTSPATPPPSPTLPFPPSAPPPTTPSTVHSSSRAPTFRLTPEPPMISMFLH